MRQGPFRYFLKSVPLRSISVSRDTHLSCRTHKLFSCLNNIITHLNKFL